MNRFFLKAFLPVLFFIINSASASAVSIDLQAVQGMYVDSLSPEAAKTDSAGHLHVVFGETELYYGYFDGTRWHFEAIEEAGNPADAFFTTHSQSLAIDADGFVHILAYDNYGDEQVLKYFNNTSGSWQVESVAPLTSGDYSSFALDADGNTHIAHYNSGDQQYIYYTTNLSGTWEDDIVNDVGVVDSLSLALGDDNLVRIAFCNNNDIMFAIQDGSGGWSVRTVDSASNYRSVVMALDSSNAAHISYYDITNTNLRYATNASGSWVTTTVENSANFDGDNSSIVVDSHDDVHIAYADTTDHTLRYATNATGSFVTSLMYDGVDDFQPALTISATDDLNVVFLYGDDLQLGHSFFDGSDWQTEMLFSGRFASNVGEYGSLALSSESALGIAYYNSDQTALEYITQTDAFWQTETVDDTAGIQFPKLRFDTTDQAHISYYNSSTRDILYATNPASVWQTETIAGDGIIVGPYTANIFADSEHLSVVYYDFDQNYLYQLTQDGMGGWSSEAIDDSGSAAQDQFTILQNTAGDLIVCYYYNTELACSSNSSGSWVRETVDDAGTSWTDISGALDSNDVVHLAYYDGNNTALKYATNASGSWVTDTLDDSASVGTYTSLVLDNSDSVTIFYYDESNTALKYASNLSGDWVIDTVDDNASVGQYASAVTDGDAYYVTYFDATHGDLKLATLDFSPEPETETNCSDGLDNDGDTLEDCDDSDCSADVSCEDPGITTETLCGDGLDDDADGLADCLDSDCSADPLCASSTTTETVCNDNLDDDADGLTDCLDSDCSADPLCASATTTETVCDDDLDDDADGLTDCADDDCDADSACEETPSPSGGGGCNLTNSPSATNSVLAITLIAYASLWLCRKRLLR